MLAPGCRVLFFGAVVLASDCDILAFFATNSSDAGEKLEWNMTSPDWCCPPGDLPQLACNDNKRVTFCDISSSGISGVIPEEFKLLDNLTTLAASDNYLTGVYGLPTSLNALDLQDNLLEGPIDFVSELSVLTSLGLGGNNFTGTLDPLVNLKYLEFMFFANTMLEGTIDALASHQHLNYIDLSVNDFQGNISALANRTALSGVILTACNFEGAIDAMSNKPYLIRIDVGSNQFSGSLDGLTGLPQLQMLQLGDNAFTGTLDSLAKLTLLQGIYLNDNLLEGNVSALANLTSLTDLRLSTNRLEGSLDALGSLTELTWLDLHANTLEGTLSSLTGLTALNGLDVGTCGLTGSLAPLSYLTALQRVDVISNHFNGTLDPVAQLTDLWMLDVGWNDLSGTIEPLTNLTNLRFFSLNNNPFEGGTEALLHLKKMTELQISHTQLNGTLQNFQVLTSLMSLDVSSSNFEGSLSHLTSLSELRDLSVAGNQLDGNLSDVAKLTKLTNLDVSSNAFTGTLDVLRTLTAARWLGVALNKFEGTLEPVQGLTMLSAFILNGNKFTGSLSWLSDLSGLRRLSALSNEFSSGVETLSSLPNLVAADIANNNFTGHFPAFQDRPLALKITGNQWMCPYPVLGQQVVVNRDGCVQDWQTLAIYAGAAIAAGLAILMMYCLCTRCNKETGLNRFIIARQIMLWILAQVLFSSDVYFFITTWQYLTSAENNCEMVNFGPLFVSFMPYYPFTTILPPPITTFAAYFAWVHANYPRSSIESDTLQQFIDLCTGFPHCTYIDVSKECSNFGASGDRYSAFVYMFGAFLCLRALKEIVKIVCVLSFCRRRDEMNKKSDMSLIQARWISRSFLLPFLAMQRFDTARKALLYSSGSVADVILWFFVEGLCQTIPQLALSLYYALVILQVGLGPVSIVSICGTALNVSWMMVQAGSAICTRKSSTESDLRQPLVRTRPSE